MRNKKEQQKEPGFDTLSEGVDFFGLPKEIVEAEETAGSLASDPHLAPGSVKDRDALAKNGSKLAKKYTAIGDYVGRDSSSAGQAVGSKYGEEPGNEKNLAGIKSNPSDKYKNKELGKKDTGKYIEQGKGTLMAPKGKEGIDYDEKDLDKNKVKPGSPDETPKHMGEMYGAKISGDVEKDLEGIEEICSKEKSENEDMEKLKPYPQSRKMEGGEDQVAERKLTYQQKKSLSPSAFVFPKERRYPIHDIAHARNALARVSAHGSSEEQKKVQDAVYAKYPSLKPQESKQAPMKEMKGRTISDEIRKKIKEKMDKIAKS